MRRYRTDMALEAVDAVRAQPGALDGIQENVYRMDGNIQVHHVKVTNQKGMRKIGKPMGNYLTIDCPDAWNAYREDTQELRKAIAQKIRELLPPENAEQPQAPILVVGLGNRSVTADALGPSVVENLLVTRHMLQIPEFDFHDMQSVCAITPGVLGITGIETAEMISGVARKVKPRAILCIDALAARDLRRIGASIQMSDTGIRPGSGVGNKRRRIDRRSMGAPVICLGIPTVAYTATIACDALEQVLKTLNPAHEGNEALLEEMYRTAQKNIGNSLVSPKEIDAMISGCARLVADALNHALQPKLNDMEIQQMLQV